MIIDELKNWARYDVFSAELAIALKYAYEANLPEEGTGKITLQGDDVFINRVSTTTRPSSAAQAENHRKYLDIHCPHNRSENIEVTTTTTALPSTLYNADDDFELYDISGTQFTIQPGQFMILFPEEIHKPCVGDTAVALEKSIIKFKISLLS